ncbi:MAG: hypothetical protein B6A08_16280 [Sorangiineae bacterium NIC37A_2]|nr:MAG: hypothetical protein B6A08_16280 [Sorangiineae bacterium NIC37A_2]
MSHLRLYQTEWCPYCRMVTRAAERLGVHLELLNVDRDPTLRQMLVARRGRGTVPVLGIPRSEGEELLGESADIIAYLEKVASSAAPGP